MTIPSAVATAFEGYRSFIEKSQSPPHRFRLTPNAEPSPFATCFALFGLQLVRDTTTLERDRDEYAKTLRAALLEYRKRRECSGDLVVDKPFLQLLTFTLSALHIIDHLRSDPLEEIVTPLLVTNIESHLRRVGALDGRPGSGNLAMFTAILLIHARDYLGLRTNERIEQWVSLHIQHMNRFGFWGDDSHMTHLQFQNGYHQYEIFDFLRIENPRAASAADNVPQLADRDGHFAPYPGGSGCYDYDAIAILTGARGPVAADLAPLLERTLQSILSSQNADGGFAESHNIRPRSVKNLLASARHIVEGPGCVRWERVRHAALMFRPKHDRIATHWSAYDRRWDESNLWDSWFRCMAIARIVCVLDPSACSAFGFVDYPGIGYHPSLPATRVRPQGEAI